MEHLKKYIKLNGNYVNIILNSVDNTINKYKSTLSVVYNNKYYSTSKIVDNNSVELSDELIEKLAKQIIFDIDKKELFNKFLKTQYVVLHRGNCKDFTENSLEALNSACKNFDGFETDIRLTKDNYWIINHDSDCKRIHNKNFIIKETNLIDILLETKIFRLKKLLFTNNYVNKLINIEIKEKYQDCNKLSRISLITTLLKFKNKILVSSFDWEWFKFINNYNIDFAHLILDISKLPKKYNKIIISKNDYENIIFKKKNLPIYGVWGVKKKVNFIDLSIIDL